MVEIVYGDGCNTTWRGFGEKIKQYLATQNIPQTLLHVWVSEENVRPAVEGRLDIVLGQKWWKPRGKTFSEQQLQVDCCVGGMWVRVSGLPDYPDYYNAGKDSADVINLLQRTLPLALEQDQERLDAMIAAAEESGRVRSREAYVKECSKRFEKTLDGTKKAITDGHAAVAKLQAELVKKIRETKGSERKLEQLEASKGGQLSEYGLEFDKLLQVPKVIRVEAKEGKVNVFTDVLFCTDPRSGIRHEIGAFRIELDTTRGAPRWFNLTRQVAGYKESQMAPHIWASGEACLGNTAEIFPTLIGAFEFSAAAMVAIQFVESVNTDDPAGKHINKWPVASEASVKTENQAAA